MEKYKEYIVGGSVRDELLGVKSKDIDYTFVFDNVDEFNSVQDAFEEMYKIISQKGKIFLSTPSCFTIRYKDNISNEIKDVVLARKELGYIKGTRQPKVVLGTLRDDLLRRDFTVNALAKDMDGNIVDLFGGQQDLQNKILRTPTDTAVSFNDDPLRILRGIRFGITKDLEFSDEIWRCIDAFDAKKMSVVSTERIREELLKCFKHDTLKTFEYLRIICLSNYSLYQELFKGGLWLKPTTEK